MKIHSARPSYPHSQAVPSTRKFAQASYPHPSEGRQNENHHHRKLAKLITWITALCNLMKLSHACVGPPKMDRSWWRILTKHGPLEKGMANHFSILALSPMNCMKREKTVKLKDEPPQVNR